MARTETVTIVCTDIVGSPEWAGRLGHAAYEALCREQVALLRGVFAKHGGAEVKSGDGFLLHFDSAASALACAVAMQQAVTFKSTVFARAASLSADEPAVRVRVGISTGEATRENGALHGRPIVEASRLCAAAKAGQIVVSEIVRLMGRGRGHTFTALGKLELDGLPEPVAACEVAWEPLSIETAGIPLPPRLPVAALAMFGRTQESATLNAAWARAKEGQRQFVLVSGEPGIGKTRLASEVGRAVHAEGGVVLLGTCDEDVNLPYQPFVQAVRHYVAHAREEVLAAHVREHKGELARLAPELAKRVTGLPAPQVAEAETERYLLFEAVAGLLSAASQQAPIILILDDLHWAGAPELLLLRHILRSTMPLRLLIVGTYRDTDLTRAHPLTAALADFRREGGVERIALHGLDEEAVVGLVAAAAGHDLTEPGIALARALQHETEGSPFFIGEILRHLRESGAIFQQDEIWTYRGDIAGLGIPEGIREVIGRRLNRLSQDANKLLTLAAVIGRQFDVELLTRIADMPEPLVIDALEQCAAAALIAEIPGSPHHFTFGHALTRTTLYEELSAARRARLHRKVGEALEELARDDPAARIDELAYHWLASAQVTDQRKAIDYARRAGEKALAKLAFEEAAAHFERALSVLQPQSHDEERLRCDLMLALTDAQRRAGNPSYRDTTAKAVDAARAIGDPERLALAALGYSRPGGYMSNSNIVDEPLIALLEEANRALAGAETILRARILASTAAELVYSPERDRRRALAHEAVDVARRAGDPLGLAAVLQTSMLAINDPFSLAERRSLSRELTELAAELGGFELEFLAAYQRMGISLEAGEVRNAEEAFGVMQRTARELRQPFFAWCAQLARTMWAILRCEPDAEAHATAALALGRQASQPDAAIASGPQFFLLRRDQGRLEELVDSTRAQVAALPNLGSWRAALTILHCETGRHEEAREQIAVLAQSDFSILLNGSWVSAMMTLSDACEQLGDGASAAILYERLLPVADQFHVISNFVLCGGSLHYGCGVLATAMRRWDVAERHCAAAIERNDRLGARSWAFRSRRALARVLLERNAPGDASRARELIEAAGAAAEALGLGYERVRLDALRERLA